MWFFISLISSIFDSFRYITGKNNTKEIDPLIVGWSQWFFGCLIFLPFLLSDSIFIPNKFWPVVFVNSVLNALATVLFWRGVQLSELTLVIPLTNFTAIFILFISPFVNGELPTTLGIFGVIITVIGAYLINLNKNAKSFFEPISSLFKQQGSRLVLFVAFLWAISSTLDKEAVEMASPITYLSYFYLFTALMLLPAVLLKKHKKIKSSFLFPLMGMGIFAGLGHLTQYYALTLSFVSYVIAVKSSSILFTIILAYFIFKEKNIMQRITGSLIMFLGVLLIIFYG